MGAAGPLPCQPWRPNLDPGPSLATGVESSLCCHLTPGRQLAPWCCRGQEPGKKYHIIKMTNPFTN